MGFWMAHRKDVLFSLPLVFHIPYIWLDMEII